MMLCADWLVKMYMKYKFLLFLSVFIKCVKHFICIYTTDIK